MQAIRPVFFGPIGEETQDLTMGLGQPEVDPLHLTAIVRRGSIAPVPTSPHHFVSVSRWRLTDEERALIASGADIVHQVMHEPGGYPPMNLQVVRATEHPGIIR